MTTPRFGRMHPLMAITAVSLTIFSLLGIGAITGLVTPAKSARMESLQATAPASASEQAITAPKAQQAANTASPKSQADTGIPHGTRHATTGTRVAAKSHNAAPEATADSGAKACAHCGEVASINLVKHDGDASGLGAVAGGVAGGVVGNQIGKGKGNILMTILGAGGGAYAGNTIEKKVKATTSYVVKVHMNDGSTRTVTMADKPSFAVGDQVRVINGGLSVIS